MIEHVESDHTAKDYCRHYTESAGDRSSDLQKIPEEMMAPFELLTKQKRGKALERHLAIHIDSMK